MRLHRLSVTGFGPFRDRQVVDFDALSDAGLFLLTGHTGAGKSSLLDAVAYALYGRVPGARASILRVRSDHADPTVATTVELELTVRGERLRVRRTPDWDRPKRRGDGTTRERGNVRLERERAGGWEVVSSRHDEVGPELVDLLGMTHDQFCQVVLLPQGDFASFLCADAESRRRLLERLFGTERFTAVESWLGTLRTTRNDAYIQALGRRSDLVARLSAVADADGPGPDAPDDVVLAWADAALATLGRARAGVEARVQAASTRLTACEAALAAARSADVRQRRLQELLARESELAVAAPARLANAAELGAARRAASVAPLLEAVDDATEAREQARRAVAIHLAEAERHGVLAGGRAAAGQRRRGGAAGPERGVAPDEATLRADERALRAELTRLDDLLADEARLTELDAQHAARRRELETTRAHETVLRAQRDAAPAQARQLDERVRRLELVAQRLAELEAVLVRAGGCEQAAVRRDDLAQQRTDAAAARATAQDGVHGARQRWLDLRERRLDGMATELAAGLEAGAACPVCGSVEHPAPAGSGQPVDDATEQAAADDLADAQAGLDRAEEQARVLADEHAVARLAAGGDEPVHELAAARATIQARRDAAARAATALPAAWAALRRHHAEAEECERARHGEEIRGHELAGDVDRLRAEAGAVRNRLTAAADEDADVVTRVARLRAGADALATAATALVGHAHAGRTLTDTERRVSRAAVTAGFADAEAAARAVRLPDQLTELDTAVADHDRSADRVAAGLADPDLAGLTPVDPALQRAALQAAVDAHAAADQARSDADGERGRLFAAHERAIQLHHDLVGAVSRLGPVRESYEIADELARLAAGTGADNRLRMRLSYYALSARLEQVADAASERLLRMTDGRFTLRHTDVRAAGTQRSGLGLEVCDGWYGTTRDPATLSGGESFMASLALALGLADVVVAEAGGTLMDTLFVDEGFGGLDEQTLDAVLDVLDDLREGGRAVGLVSHVAELRDRIPARLDVTKAQHGSSLALTA